MSPQLMVHLMATWLTFTVLVLVCVLQPLAVCASRVPLAEGIPKDSLALLGNLHYDALFGRPGGYGVCNQGQISMVTPGCDSPLTLIKSVMDDINNCRGMITLITGSLFRHGAEFLTSREIEYMMRDVLEVIAQNGTSNNADKDYDLGHSTQLALGETDFIPASSFTPGGKQALYLQLLGMMLSYDLLSSEEYSAMTSCGYYYRDLSGTKLRIISLNTMLWSTALRPPLGVGDVDPCGQFPFLQNAIEQATQRGRNVIIVGDTPPVLNVADALRKRNVQEATYFWRDDFREAYFRIIATYRFKVGAQFFGHTNVFGFVASPELGPPMYIIPSISPVTGSNPSYMRATLDGTTGRVVALRQRYLDENGTWVEGESLEDAINVSLRGMGEYFPKDYLLLAESEARWENMAAMRVGGRFLTEREPCDIWCRRVIACSSLYYERDAIDRCASIQSPSQKLGLVLAIVFTCFGVILVCSAFAYVLIHFSIIFDPPVVLGTGKGRRRLF
ncbi:beta-fructofuranosidase-like protein, partial [Trypanosoma grayi]|uniref:beta-fructofuranosidase-like protein n=1 Tax=Trypanosoma grayi TaxID=71804 RepID=UPI0004F4BA86